MFTAKWKMHFYTQFIRSLGSTAAQQFSVSGRGSAILAFQLCGILSGVKMPPYHCCLLSASFANLFSFCRREKRRNVVGVPINTTGASDPDTGVLYFFTKEQQTFERKKA